MNLPAFNSSTSRSVSAAQPSACAVPRSARHLSGAATRSCSYQSAKSCPHRSRQVWTSGNDTGPWSYFGPWEKTIGAAFFPGVLEYRSAPSPWTEGSSVILDHFVAYVKGAVDTGLHLGQPPN